MHPEGGAGRERGLRGAVLAGDERAWQTWVAQEYAGLRAYVGWRCAGLGDLADEVVQESWLTAVRRLRSFDPDLGPFASWLRGIAANVLRNQLRARARRYRHQRSLNGAAGLLAKTDSENRERSERVARTLAALPDHYEAVLRAKYLDQLSVAQIAAAGDATPKAVESLLTRARQAFRDVYERA
jgi:RNA polymerase sigma-70 factor (ECF subfamily)